MGTAERKRIWLLVPPWVILGAVAVLVPLFAFFTWENVNRHKEMSTRLLLEKGEALIRSFEAGARAGEGMAWGSFQLQKLLIETAQQPGVDYLVVTDTEGRILADSDPGMVGGLYGTELDLEAAHRKTTASWRTVTAEGGAETLEVYRRFAPRDEPYGGFARKGPGASYLIFVGLDMAPVQQAHDQDEQRIPAGEPHEREHVGRERRDQDRDLLAHHLLVDHQGHDERRKPEDRQDVEDVAAHHVADGDVHLPGPGRLHGDRELGRAGAEGHHREPYHER